ncbi:MAG: hypothetical protein LBJ72_12095 [Dysgonamonadaceae bacterium]|jgi:hypothetical protein|nr:hypothetical protein [Dysgonamonadaceae bacterium]
MKTKILNCLLVGMLVLSFGCSNETGIMDYPKVIDVISLDLREGCVWSYNAREISIDSAYVINSQETLSKFISCDDDHQVDFDKNTVLFVWETATSDIYLRSYKLIQLSQDKFQLELNVEQGMTTAPGSWQVALSIPKITQKAAVNLIINRINNIQ